MNAQYFCALVFRQSSMGTSSNIEYEYCECYKWENFHFGTIIISYNVQFKLNSMGAVSEFSSNDGCIYYIEIISQEMTHLFYIETLLNRSPHPCKMYDFVNK